MKTTPEPSPSLLKNEHLFRDPFFQRFRLRHAPAPLALSDTLQKDYLFPTLYTDVTCAIGIFHCDYARAKALLPHPKLTPVRMPRGRSLVALSCYEYKNVLHINPYNEIAMTIPVLFDPRVNLPVIPMVLPSFPSFGYYVFGMPVTSKENQLRGNKIWGLPKVTEEIDTRIEDERFITTARDESGEEYFRLKVPMTGKSTLFDVKAHIYSALGNSLLRSRTYFRGNFKVTKFMGQLFSAGGKCDQEYLTLGPGQAAKTLRELDIEERPFQFRYASRMTSAFDLPDSDFCTVIGDRT